MSRPGLSPIDLTRLSPPLAIDPLDFEGLVTAMRDQLVALFPAIVNVIDLESQPARKLIEVFAYRELLMRARVNDKIRAVLPALASGADLDHLAAHLGVERLVVEPERDDVPAVMEDDARLLRRMQLAPSAFGTAGAQSAYAFFALTSAPTIRDASAIQTAPGEVLVTLLGADQPQPTDAEIAAVRATLDRPDIRPLTDAVTVSGPAATSVSIEVGLRLYPGPSETALLAESRARLAEFAGRSRALGFDVMRSAIAAAAFVEGVHSVEVTGPATDVRAAPDEVIEITGVTVVSLGAAS